MFQIIKTGQSKSNPKQSQLHYVNFPRKDCSSPPPLVLSAAAYTQMSAGGKRQFVKVNEEMFVNEIKKRPILYNTHLKDYKKFSTRHEAWAEVAVAMNLSEGECKKRWRSLRDAFMKVVRNKSEEEQKTWIHYRLLEFLLPYIANRTRGTSRTVELMDDFDEDTEYVEIEEDMDIFEESRQPITVSYVTEDGKEVFQMLQDPDTIPEGAVIGIEETEEEDEGEEDEMFPAMHHSEQMTPNETLHSQDNHTGSFMYEERLDSTMLELQEAFESTRQASFADASREEGIKQEALSDADGSEIHVEEIEMDSLISEQPDDYQTDTQSEAQHLMEALRPSSIRDPSPVEDLLEPPIHEPIPVATEPTHSPTPPPITNSALSLPVEAPEPISTNPVPMPSVSLPREESTIRESDTKPSSSSCMDSDERFLLSCAPILRRLPNKKNQLARLRIQQLLFELEYDEKYNS